MFDSAAPRGIDTIFCCAGVEGAVGEFGRERMKIHNNTISTAASTGYFLAGGVISLAR
jgi:hypothetical protein